MGITIFCFFGFDYPESYNELYEYGIQKGKCHFCYDLAILLPEKSTLNRKTLCVSVK